MKIIRPANLADQGTPFSRASTATMIDKTGTLVSVAANVPRFTYDQNGNPPRLLLEKAATNLLLYSENMTNSAWGAQVGGTVTSNALAAPNGATTASKFVSSSADGYVGQTSPTNATSGTTYTFSVWLKVPSGTLSTYLYANYNGVTIGNQISVSTSWARYQLTFTATAAGSMGVQIGGSGTITNGVELDMWGAQLESGSSATSYISTTSAAVTRSADTPGNNLISILTENDAPAWSSSSIYVLGDQVVYTDHTIYESNTGSAGTVSLSVASSGAAIVVNWNAHGAAAGTPVMFTSGTLPSGISLNTVYYVTSTGLTANSFELATTSNGTTAITSTTTGTLTGVAARYSTNYNMTPSSNLASTSTTASTGSAVWLDAGPTNKYAILDQSVESQSSNAYELNFAFASPSTMFADSVVIQNANAQMIRVTVFDWTDGVVYDQTMNMVADIDDPDFYEYCFEPIVRNTDVLFSGLPPYSSGYISISLLDTSGTPACGLCVIGQSKNFGPTQAGMSIGIQDYSLKTKDAFGHTDIEPRPYAKTMDLTAFVDRTSMNTLVNLLNSLRATPTVYIGDESLTCSFQYGFFKDYTMGADYVEHSTLHIQIESLT